MTSHPYSLLIGPNFWQVLGLYERRVLLLGVRGSSICELYEWSNTYTDKGKPDKKKTNMIWVVKKQIHWGCSNFVAFRQLNSRVQFLINLVLQAPNWEKLDKSFFFKQKQQKVASEFAVTMTTSESVPTETGCQKISHKIWGKVGRFQLLRINYLKDTKEKPHGGAHCPPPPPPPQVR